MKYLIIRLLLSLLVGIPVFVSPVSDAWAHHIMGRPSYGLNEDSNTPPSMQFESQIGDYFVTFMAFPAFPRPGERGRLNLYAVNSNTGKAFQGLVTFSVRDDSLFSSKEERLGTQKIDGVVFRQGVVFKKEGNYIAKAFFENNGTPYQIEMPLRIGNPLPILPIVLSVGTVILVIGGVAGLRIGKRRRTRIRKSRLSHNVERTVRD